MEMSILTSIKKLLGIEKSYDHFDQEIIIHINSAFMNLNMLGIGPEEGFSIESDDAEWNNFIGQRTDLQAIKTYIYLKVRLLFDPPQMGYLVEAITKQISELEWRLTVQKETKDIEESGSSETPKPNHMYVQSPNNSVPYIRELNGAFQYFTNGQWKTIGNDFPIDQLVKPADLISNDIENAIVLGTDDKLFVPRGALPYVLYLVRESGNAVLTETKPIENQQVLDRIWRSVTWGVWTDIATFQFSESLLRSVANIVIGNLFTAKLWLTSDIAVPNAQLRITIMDSQDDTILAQATSNADLNNINTILTPVTFINKFSVSKAIPINQIKATLSVMVLAPAVQFGLVSNLPANLSFTTIMSSGSI